MIGEKERWIVASSGASVDAHEGPQSDSAVAHWLPLLRTFKVASSRTASSELWIPLPSSVTESHERRAYASTIFFNLFHALDRMGELPEHADQSIDQETKEEAEEVLNLIQQYDIDPPQVFSHGGDAVVFTWKRDRRNRYLTVSGGEIAVLDVDSVSRVECSYPFIPLRSHQLENCMARIGPSIEITDVKPR